MISCPPEGRLKSPHSIPSELRQGSYIVVSVSTKTHKVYCLSEKNSARFQLRFIIFNIVGEWERDSAREVHGRGRGEQ